MSERRSTKVAKATGRAIGTIIGIVIPDRILGSVWFKNRFDRLDAWADRQLAKRPTK